MNLHLRLLWTLLLESFKAYTLSPTSPAFPPAVDSQLTVAQDNGAYLP